jgi:hypothetical protein
MNASTAASPSRKRQLQNGTLLKLIDKWAKPFSFFLHSLFNQIATDSLHLFLSNPDRGQRKK